MISSPFLYANTSRTFQRLQPELAADRYIMDDSANTSRTFQRLQLFALAYNLANFLRRLALPGEIGHWSLTTLRDKLVTIGAKVTRRSKYVIFQLAEVAVTWKLFAAILDRMERLALPPPDINGRMLA